MTSHGIPRSQHSASKTDEQQAREQRQIEEYKALETDLQEELDRGALNLQSLTLTSKLLKKNPEYYTVWNQRRRILLRIFAEEPSDEEDVPTRIRSLLNRDMEFLLPLLMSFPKCYWIWNHRWWLLQQFSSRLSPTEAVEAWQGELGLDSKMLSRDSRNFHGWDYRRQIVSEILKLSTLNETRTQAENDALIEQEFDYTKKLLRINLSNFSAWHNRSTLIQPILDARKASMEERQALFGSELDFLKGALFTDPQDQSLWFYHQYLMSVLLTETPAEGRTRDAWVTFTNHDREGYLRQEIEDIRELLEDTDDVKWIYQYLLEYATEYIRLGIGTDLVTKLEMREWMDRLKSLDPLRKGRWHDLERKLNI